MIHPVVYKLESVVFLIAVSYLAYILSGFFIDAFDRELVLSFDSLIEGNAEKYEYVTKWEPDYTKYLPKTIATMVFLAGCISLKKRGDKSGVSESN